jgi:hypothetical protein
LYIYKNGAVSIGGKQRAGGLYIKALSTTQLLSGDVKVGISIDPYQMFESRAEHIMDLLNRGFSVEEINHMVVLTWSNVNCDDSMQAPFQIALVSKEATEETYALLLFEDIGCKVDIEICANRDCPNLTDTTSNIGRKGAFIYRIDDFDKMLPPIEDCMNQLPTDTDLMETNVDLNGPYRLLGHNLHTMTIHRTNGMVTFDDSCRRLSISGFNTDLEDSNAKLFFSDKISENFETIKKNTICLIHKGFNLQYFDLTDLVVVTWSNFEYCSNPEPVTFQIAIATTNHEETYALLLYNETGNKNCTETTVEVGFNADEASYTHPLTYGGEENIPALDSASNIGVEGVFVYRIDEFASPPQVY